MAYSSTFTVSGAILAKAGVNINPAAYTETNLNYFTDFGESYICVVTRRNWIDDYAGLNADVKNVLGEALACWVAMDLISYDMTYNSQSRIHAEDRVNIHWAKFNRILAALMDKKKEQFMDSES